MGGRPRNAALEWGSRVNQLPARQGLVLDAFALWVSLA